MEGLMELVAASFLRHGIECPAPSSARQTPVAAPSPPTALPEHNYRWKPEDGPARQA